MNADSFDQTQADALAALRGQLGERPTFDTLILRRSRPLRRYVLRLTSDADAADDLAQEIRLSLVRGIARLREVSKFRS